MITACISGLGKTGKEVANFFLKQHHIEIVSAICSPHSDKNGKDLGEIIGGKQLGIPVESSDDLEEVLFRTRPDVFVDFSSAEAVLKHAKVISRMKINMVIGTTGFSDLEIKKLYVLSHKYRNGIVYAPNITLGVNVLMVITNLASNLLNNYDFQVTETHHKHKKDAPSGTAIKIAKEIEKGLKSSTQAPVDVEIPITAVRAGGVVGKHEVQIIGEEDKIEISHESFSRKAFALGALRAVQFIKGKVGFYEMKDVLNLEKVLRDYLDRETKLANEKITEFMQIEKTWAL